MYDLIVRDATIVTSSGRLVADVATRKGRIAYVGPRPPRRAREEINAIGKFLVPGVIDTAALLSPGDDPATWESESRAAVSGGITTVVARPGGDEVVVDAASARARIAAAAGSSWCHHALWGGATGDNADALDELARAGLTVGTLACLDPGAGAPSMSPAALDAHAGCCGVLGVQIDPAVLEDDGDERRDELLAALTRASEGGRRVHLLHLSSSTELQMLDPVRGDLPLSAGVTPHHLFLASDNGGPVVRTHPPVRPEHDRRTLWTAVKRGRIDCVASDHHPSPSAEADGVPGAEILFPLMLSAVKYGRLSLELLVSLCSESPARIFGLERKGRIERGADADLVLFSEGEVTRVSGDMLLSAAGWTPYLDREVAPKPDLVLVAGEVVARDGVVVGESPAGVHVGPARA